LIFFFPGSIFFPKLQKVPILFPSPLSWPEYTPMHNSGRCRQVCVMRYSLVVFNSGLTVFICLKLNRKLSHNSVRTIFSMTFYLHFSGCWIRWRGAIQIIHDTLNGRVATVSPNDTGGRGPRGSTKMSHSIFLSIFDLNFTTKFEN